ncbi:MAG: ABC transporter permease subunit [Alphaproteobacteria bacterium]
MTSTSLSTEPEGPAPVLVQGEPEERAPVEGRSLWDDALARLRRNRAAMVSLGVLGVIALLAIVGPWLSPYTLEGTDWGAISRAPSFSNGHIFGTDGTGRDIFVRTLWGARVSLAIGIVATAVSLVIGVLYGATAGYLGGRVDTLMMRFVDILYSLPFVFFVIILITVFGRNFILLFVAIGAIEWLTMARIVRGQTLSIRQKEFIEAARATGVDTVTILRRHILPNVIGVVMIYATLTVPTVILVESFLSYLGLGVQEPMTSWGRLISEGAPQMDTAWWTLVFPAGFMAVTLFCFNYIGDGLRDAFDPKDRSA